MKVFLGGTVAGSKWRDYLIPKLEVDYFNPVVESWTEEEQKKELAEREKANFCLYVLTPKMQGWYSLAEVADDSYKKSDKTIFCFLEKEEDKKFTKEQITELQKLGKLVRSNGAIWKQSLDEVIDFLNSANSLSADELLQQNKQINNAFISYGRRHSLAFARKLYQNFTKRGYDIWFDMNDIPLGVDFQEQIDEGIRKADNFIYIMSPHSINSVYCYKELVLALKYNKRIIPILNIEPQDDVTWNKIDPEIGKRNWIYMRQNPETGIELSAKALKLDEKILDISENEWNLTDDFNAGLENLFSLIDSHRAYVRTHTVLLDASLDWLKDSRNTHKLLVGRKREEAELFLERSHQNFKTHSGHLIQAPCKPTDLIAEFIMESKKNAHNLQSDLFICHDVGDAQTVNKISARLALHGFSSWISSRDISKGVEYNHAIHNGVVQSANMLLFISEKSLKSEYCKKEYNFALEYNKRIIPVLIEPNPKVYENPEDFPGLQDIQFIDFTDLTDEIKIEVKDYKDVKADVEARREKTPYENSVDELVSTLNYERLYYEEHRLFLSQALYWKEQGEKQSFLLRGFNLENAETWLRLSKERKENPPLAIHEEFIEASESAKGQLGTDVFLSYSRKDGDLARLLNRKLQTAGKTTWFDQESISKGVDFEKEIFKGIDACDNFVFLISPDAILSEYCAREVDYAVSQNKRIITLLARSTEAETMPEALRIVNWIDFSKGEFDDAFADLIQAIELDREHTATHTLLQQRANEWNDQKQSPDFLMNLTACGNAEKWLSQAFEKPVNTIYENPAGLSSVKKPKPTQIQINYIKISREKITHQQALARQRQRRIIFIISIATVISIAFGVFGFVNMQRTKVLTTKGYLKDAKNLIDKENYASALQKYIYLRDTIKVNNEAIREGIIICDYLDSVSKIFYTNLHTADSLTNTDKIENYLKADSLYKYTQSLQYVQGERKLKQKMETFAIKRKNIISVNISRAEKYIKVPDKALFTIAKKLLISLKKIAPENKKVQELLKISNT